MKHYKKKNLHYLNNIFPLVTITTVLVISLNGCSGMSKSQKSTAIVPGVCAAAGAIVTKSDVLCTFGGLAIGGSSWKR